ncbi:MAG: hypothetical protein WDN26_06680 [Chitinophagaceae bacterium]
MQIHNSYEGRVEVVRETTLASFKNDPKFIRRYRDEFNRRFCNQHW